VLRKVPRISLQFSFSSSFFPSFSLLIEFKNLSMGAWKKRTKERTKRTKEKGRLAISGWSLVNNQKTKKKKKKKKKKKTRALRCAWVGLPAEGERRSKRSDQENEGRVGWPRKEEFF